MKNIKQDLLNLKDQKYLEFHSNLCKNVNLIGIRIPVLRDYAKKLFKENINDIDTLLNNIDIEYYEEIMLKGMIIAFDQKVGLEKLFQRLDEYIPLLDNWATCDTLCASLKITKKYPQEIFDYVKSFFKSKKTYDLRFALVMCLGHYVEKKYLQEVFPLLGKIKNHDYYVNMALAWFLSVCLVKEYDYTIEYLKENTLDEEILKMMMQKVRDSYRISPKQKHELTSLF